MCTATVRHCAKMWTTLVFAVCSIQLVFPWSAAEGSVIQFPSAAGVPSDRWRVVDTADPQAQQTVLTFKQVGSTERFLTNKSFRHDALIHQTDLNSNTNNDKTVNNKDTLQLFSVSSTRGIGTGNDLDDKTSTSTVRVVIENHTSPYIAVPATTPAECGDYHQLNTSAKKCAFLKTNRECGNKDGFINYLQVIHCTFPDYRVLGFIVLGLWLLYLLIALGVTAEEFFCPDLEVMSRTLKMSQNIAGVTLLAFGNGAPDIFSAIAAVTNARNGEAGLAIGALFGAGIFVTTVVAGSIAVTRPFKMVQRPFLRDAIFYLAAAFWTFTILYKGQITFAEAIGYIVLYLAYVVVVFVGRKIYQSRKRQRQKRESSQNGVPVDGYLHNDYVPPAPALDAELTATERLVMASILNVDQDIARSITRQPSSIYPESETDETKPLLGGSHQHPPPGQIKEFFIGLCPVDIKTWSEKAWYSKIWEIIKSPLIFLLKATVPVVDYDEPKHNWNRLLNVLNLLTAPTFCAFVTKGLTKTVTGNLQAWGLILPISVLLAVIVFFTSRPDKQPIYHWAFAYIGFVVAILWIYSTANEIVNILQMFGVEFAINDAILGLTVLAWGNSIGDLVSDITMARQGFPTMGMSACFGGPMFNMLLGIGISCIITTIRDGGTFMLVTNKVQMILAMGLAASLLSSMFIMLLTRFHATKWYGIYLYALYLVVLTTAILVEVGVIPWT